MGQDQLDRPAAGGFGAFGQGHGRHAGSRSRGSRPRRWRAGATAARRSASSRNSWPARRWIARRVDRVDRGERLVEGQDPVVERLLAADPRGDVAGVVHPQLEAAGQVALGLGQLGLGDQLVAQPGQLDEDRLERGRQTGRVDAGRDLEGPGIGVVDQPGRDVVGEPELLAHRQEQPAAHAVAEDGVEDGQGPAVGMVAVERRDARGRAGPGWCRACRSGRARPAGRAGAGAKPGIGAVAGPERRGREARRLLVGAGRRRPRRPCWPAGRRSARSRGWPPPAGPGCPPPRRRSRGPAARRRTSRSGTGSGSTRTGRRGTSGSPR